MTARVLYRQKIISVQVCAACFLTSFSEVTSHSAETYKRKHFNLILKD